MVSFLNTFLHPGASCFSIDQFTFSRPCLNSVHNRIINYSLPLPECKMYGRTNTLNTHFFNPRTTSFACFDFMGKRIWDFVKWSITWHIQLNSPSGVLRKSIRSIYKRIGRFPVQAPLDANLGLGTQFHFDLPVTFGLK